MLSMRCYFLVSLYSTSVFFHLRGIRGYYISKVIKFDPSLMTRFNTYRLYTVPEFYNDFKSNVDLVNRN